MVDQHPLLDSACEFLAEALENHRDRKDAFAIVHAVTACELVPKELLSRVHPSLVFRDIDARAGDRSFTVALSKLPQRLANFGVPLREHDRELVAYFAEWRNQVVHHLPTYDPASARSRLPKLLDFLMRVVRQNLQADPKDLIPTRLYSTALELLEEWQPEVEQARNRARAAGAVLPEPCPQCGASGVLTTDGEDRVTCHLCGVGHYVYDHCAECGRTTPLRLCGFLDEQNICDDCVEAAGDLYIQQLIDRERGK